MPMPWQLLQAALHPFVTLPGRVMRYGAADRTCLPIAQVA
ncbi:hypothetical protein SAMN05660489_06146 [Pseudomonas sp. LAMO17WK12:I10]|nr:hypothetical protein H160_06116 [Pseudomonas sp. LAMO17WK12:I9]SNY53260.1 hypothetical protein SAMN05660489_06146 [Pseudomonas sp. LAMO17WK12:I10]